MKKTLVVLGVLLLMILMWAPWMSIASQERQSATYRSPSELVAQCQEVQVSWVPFGRRLSTCDRGNQFMWLWWK
jgi:hypothetical protein